MHCDVLNDGFPSSEHQYVVPKRYKDKVTAAVTSLAAKIRDYMKKKGVWYSSQGVQ